MAAALNAPALGETTALWRKAGEPGSKCGCGVPVVACELWRRVHIHSMGLSITDAGGLAARERVRQVQNEAYSITRLKSLRKELSSGQIPHEILELREAYVRLYQAAADGGRLVESVKSIGHLLVMASDPRVSLKVIHVLRDPKRVAASFSRERVMQDGAALKRLPRRTALVRWAVQTGLASSLRSSIVGDDAWFSIRFEDFVAEPRATTRFLAQWAGAEPIDPFESPRLLRLPLHHCIDGNAVRFSVGPIEIHQL